MTASVKPLRNFGTKIRLDALRLQLMAGEMSVRIGQRIREARRSLDLNQRELAVRINAAAEANGGVTPIDNQRVSDWERGVNKPSERYMDLLAEALNKSVAWFYENPAKPQETPDLLGQSQLDRMEQQIQELRDLVELIATSQQATRALTGPLAGEPTDPGTPGAGDETPGDAEAPHEGTTGNASTPGK